MKRFWLFIIISIFILIYTGCMDTPVNHPPGNKFEVDEDVKTLLDGAKVITYPGPESIQHSDFYTMEANGNPVFIYSAKVLNNGTAAYAYFDFSGTVLITVSLKIVPETVVIRPLSYQVKPLVDNNTISFLLSEPANLTLEINNSYMNVLHIFANPLEENPPDPDDPDVVYFGPGIHQPGPVRIGSNKTIYIAGGAYIKGTILPGERPVILNANEGNDLYQELFSSYDAENIRICGRGIIDMSGIPHQSRFTVWFRNCRNFEMEGIIIQDAPMWHFTAFDCTDGRIDNVKVIGHRLTGDGIDLINCRDITVENSFIRSGDDCIRAATFDIDSPLITSGGITVKHSVIWNDYASGIGVTFNNSMDIRNVLFTDIDIIHDFTDIYHAAAISISAGDSKTIEDVRFEDIRVEQSRSALIHLWIGKDYYSIHDTRGFVKNIRFSNITYTGEENPRIKLTGYSHLHRIEHIVFEDFRYRDEYITSVEPGIFDICYTEDIEFYKQGEKIPQEQTTFIYDTSATISGASLPVARWSFDEDITNATYFGNCKFSEGIKGKGFLCNSSDGFDYIEINNLPALSSIHKSDYTISAWYKPLSIPKGIAGSKNPSHGIVMKAGYHIGLLYTREKQFVIDHFITPGKYAGTRSFRKTYEPGSFYFLAGVVNQTAGIVTLFVNGICVGQNNFAPGAPTQPLSAPWRIGIGDPQNTGYPYPAHGIIDEVLFFDCALSDKQISDLYNESKGK